MTDSLSSTQAKFSCTKMVHMLDEIMKVDFIEKEISLKNVILRNISFLSVLRETKMVLLYTQVKGTDLLRICDEVVAT